MRSATAQASPPGARPGISSETAAAQRPSLPRGSPLKVALIMPLGEQRGGGELMLLQLVEYGRGLGVEWLVIFLEDGPMVSQVRSHGVEARVIDAGRLRQPHVGLAAVWKISRLLKQWKADGVLSWMAKAHLYGGSAALLARTPALWYQLGIPVDPGALDRFATRIPALGVFVCSKAAGTFQEAIPPRRPVRVVYPGVELSRFDPATLPSMEECRRRLNLPVGVPIVGMVGRMQRWKGMHVLLDAMPEILSQHPDTRCVLVGGQHKFEPEYPEFLRQRIANLGLAERVIMPGLQQNIPEWMQAMDVVVHASDNEPFGIVVIEAMALGKAVVAGAEGGPTEIVTNGTDGLLAPFGDAPALANAIHQYLSDPQLCHRAGSRARDRAMEFSVDRYSATVARFTQELLAPCIQRPVDVK